MKKKILSVLLAAAVIGSVSGGLASVEAKAAENSVQFSDKQENFSVDFIRADHYDFANVNKVEFPGHASVGDAINFKAKATGGVGEITYEYCISANYPNSSYIAQLSTSPDFTWTPQNNGEYCVEVIAHDKLGNTTSAGCLYMINKAQSKK